MVGLRLGRVAADDKPVPRYHEAVTEFDSA
jgi:hypothetical protein